MLLGTRDSEVELVLNAEEVDLLRCTLERALFIDTPPRLQADIAAFASRLLDTLSTAPLVGTMPGERDDR